MRIVLALGGNALLRRDQPLELEVQRRNIKTAVAAISAVARQHEVVVTHGNGPQVGLLALQAAAYQRDRPYPLDVLVAESEGMIGYLLEQGLVAALPGREIATLLTQVEVDAADPAFDAPRKPIGPTYDAEEARRLAAERAWTFAPQDGRFRRVVPSPTPQRILEINAIRILVEAGALVVCTGGGGIPVVVSALGSIRGIEAVIDKDLSAALLAEQVGASWLLLLTDVSGVWTHWRDPTGQLIAEVTPDQLRSLQFMPGSMGPKVEAACRFVGRTGGTAAIGALEDPLGLLRGSSGTIIRPGTGRLELRQRPACLPWEQTQPII
jgi:carbamate kinase